MPGNDVIAYVAPAGANNKLQLFSVDAKVPGATQLTRSAVDKHDPALGLNGSIVLYHRLDDSGISNIYWMLAFGGDENQLTFGSAHKRNAQLSPDGTKLSYLQWDPAIGTGGKWRLYVQAVDIRLPTAPALNPWTSVAAALMLLGLGLVSARRMQAASIA
jgi:Tol biopolymer transport system component